LTNEEIKLALTKEWREITPSQKMVQFGTILFLAHPTKNKTNLILQQQQQQQEYLALAEETISLANYVFKESKKRPPKEPKKKSKRKEKKKGEHPKRPKSAFLHFSDVERAAIKEQNPELSFTETAKLLGEKWRTLPEEKKKVKPKQDEKKTKNTETKQTTNRNTNLKQRTTWRDISCKKSPHHNK
jgi:hypothetical protein